MDFHGRYSIPAPPHMVWEALNDPDTLKACIPGCERLERTDATHFAATAILKIGPVKATFKAAIEQSELDPPRRCVLKGEGQGGVAGFARGEAEVSLVPQDGGTVLSYTAKASIGGKLAQIGQRLIDGAAKQIADDFFSRFAALIAASAQTDAAAAEAPAAPPSPVPPAAERIAGDLPVESRREGLAPKIWVAGLLGVVIVLLAIFGLVFA